MENKNLELEGRLNQSERKNNDLEARLTKLESLTKPENLREEKIIVITDDTPSKNSSTEVKF